MYYINPYNIIKKLDSKDLISHIIKFIPETNYFLKKRKIIYFKNKDNIWNIYLIIEYNNNLNTISIIKYNDFYSKIYNWIKRNKIIINIGDINPNYCSYSSGNICEFKNYENLENWRKDLFVFGKQLDVTDYQGFWYTSKIIGYDKYNYMIKIRYDEWSDRWDHWIPANHPFLIAPYKSKALGGKGTFILNDYLLKNNLIDKYVLNNFKNYYSSNLSL